MSLCNHPSNDSYRQTNGHLSLAIEIQVCNLVTDRLRSTNIVSNNRSLLFFLRIGEFTGPPNPCYQRQKDSQWTAIVPTAVLLRKYAFDAFAKVLLNIKKQPSLQLFNRDIFTDPLFHCNDFSHERTSGPLLTTNCPQKSV